MAAQTWTQFCERCQAIKFDETKYEAKPVRTPHGFRLDIPRTKSNKFVQEGFNSRINEHLGLHVFNRTDCFPHSPQLSKTAPTCDFCGFLKQCLLSKDVALAAADQGVDLDNEKFQIGIRLAYSWEPKRTENRSDIGLDALYVYILNIDPNFSKAGVWGPSLAQDVFCGVRCTIYSSPGLSLRIQKTVNKHSTDHSIIGLESSSKYDPCVQWLRLREPPTTDASNEPTRSWMSQILRQCESGEAKHQSCAKL